MGLKNVRFLVYMIIVLLRLSWEWDNLSCANAGNHKSKKSAKNTPPPPNINGGSGSSNSTTFSVLNYGAKGNGIADDTNAFAAAWTDACKVQGSVMLVPSGSVFFVKPISFSGPSCQSNIVFQLDGKIIAPTDPEPWGSGLLQWMQFTKLNKITIRGNGIIDGQGSAWWNNKKSVSVVINKNIIKFKMQNTGRMPSTRPTALRFYGSRDVTVTGITIQNSQQTHLKFDSCIGVQVFGISISSPGDSPNTDGIHLQNSQNVVIHTASVACGDDCISIQTGCSNVNMYDINCGPGHGISIGALGPDGTKACVSNINVRDSTIRNASNGLRIKTWQGGSGLVKGVTFTNVQVSGVGTPLMINQFYCNSNKCANKTSAVGISDISYQSIKGTYTVRPVYFACSDSRPCVGVKLANVELTPFSRSTDPFCWEAYGNLQTATIPPINCLRSSSSSSSGSVVKVANNTSASC
ncbi:polygalacturonase At1g48100-like [Primulina huaijiensis]|uniref:polygalacturonase At1g48100-like n=1 Tax=Primulina huaijiensis TaxID=1492673 RepID=UPI003CC78F33